MNSTATVADQVASVYTSPIDNLRSQIAESIQKEDELTRLIEEQRRYTEKLKQHEQGLLAARSAAITVLEQAINAFRLADSVDPTGNTGNELLDTIGNIREAIWSGDDLPALPGNDDDTNEPDDLESEVVTLDEIAAVEVTEVENAEEETISDRVEQVKEANGRDDTGADAKTIMQTVMTDDKLLELSYSQIKKLGSGRNVKLSGGKAAVVERIRLSDKPEVSQEEYLKVQGK
jgi:hypothetical protein